MLVKRILLKIIGSTYRCMIVTLCQHDLDRRRVFSLSLFMFKTFMTLRLRPLRWQEYKLVKVVPRPGRESMLCDEVGT